MQVDFTKGQNQYDLSRALFGNAVAPIKGASAGTAIGKVLQAYFAQKGMNKGEAAMGAAEQAGLDKNAAEMAAALKAYGGESGTEQNQDALLRAMMSSSNPQHQNAALTQALATPKDNRTNLQRNYEAALSQGYKGSIFDYQRELKKAGASSVNVGAGFKMPAGHMENPNYDPNKPVSQENAPVMPIPGSKTEREYNKPTATQSTAANYASRMVQDEKTLTGLVEQGFNPTQISEHAADKAGALGNFWKSSEGQQYRQAQEDWVRAKLRKESGAVIADEEMEREIRVYFPQPGDSPEVVRQKSIQRMIAANGMIKEADIAYEGDLYDIPEPEFNAPQYSQEDLEFTAQKHGITVEEVKRRLGQ